MTPTLRLCLTTLVVMNLVFVQATQAASLSWLVPMYALALASNVLGRFRDTFVFRAAWNLAVIGLFGVLVQHATSTGLAYLLEDGLRLAAICQVHLLNNLGDRQRPDLLFFNSFLIAVVTSFLTRDIVYSIVFLAYAPLLVMALGIYCVSPAGSGRLPEGVVAAVARDGVRKAAVVVAVTMAAFLLVPRDFNRRGVLGKRLNLDTGAGALALGFSEQVKLERTGPVAASGNPVLRVKVEHGDRGDVPLHWRGATFLTFDGKGWMSGPVDVSREESWRSRSRGLWTRETAAPVAGVQVELLEPNVRRLFVPLHAVRLQLGAGAGAGLVEPEGDGTIRYGTSVDRVPGPLVRYRIDVVSGPAPDGLRRESLPRGMCAATRIDPGTVPPEAVHAAAEALRGLPEDAPQHVMVEAMRRQLSSRDDYVLPGGSGAADEIAEFLRGDAGGHCEFFATALALMLRTQEIPCRLVTGYLSNEWDAEGAVLTVRRRDAHAWIEVNDPVAGWYTVDPSPAGALAASAGPSLMEMAQLWMHRTWDRVLEFDDKARAKAFAWIAAAPGRTADWAAQRPWSTAMSLSALIACWILLRRLRRRSVPAAVRAYQAALRAARVAPMPGETPREVLERARRSGVPAPRVAGLETATAAHETARYARA